MVCNWSGTDLPRLSRLQQDGSGSHYIDNSNSGLPFGVSARADLELIDVLPAFVVPSAHEAEPVRLVAKDFVEQLDPVDLLAGRSPLIGLRLTSLRNGSVLGISLSHVLSGAKHSNQNLCSVEDESIFQKIVQLGGLAEPAAAPEGVAVHILHWVT